MADNMGNIPGGDAAANSLNTATQSFQTFAAEVQRMSKESIEHTTQTMEQLRGAKSMEDVVSIQTTYMQKSFASYADYTRRFSELMMSLPMEFAKQGRAAFQQGADAATKAGQQAGEQMRDAGQQFDQHHG